MFEFDDAFDAAWSGRCSITPALIVFCWSSQTNRDPWSAMPLDDRFGYLRRLVDELLDLGDGIDSPARGRRLFEIARRHGAYRRRQSCEKLIVLQDFAALREALRDAMAMAGVPPHAIRHATRSLLPDWRMARRAALLGFVGA
jgi:hypothetical protein